MGEPGRGPTGLTGALLLGTTIGKTMGSLKPMEISHSSSKGSTPRSLSS